MIFLYKGAFYHIQKFDHSLQSVTIFSKKVFKQKQIFRLEKHFYINKKKQVYFREFSRTFRKSLRKAVTFIMQNMINDKK